ncbi:hypothetical protein RND81_06G114900 [Saponaria officinalis]|uniref:Uncharacterized protein n=1 Tax=Saponaria officinalis TaxID=3572 RepID=A0AAW1K8Y0_SAPOF
MLLLVLLSIPLFSSFISILPSQNPQLTLLILLSHKKIIQKKKNPENNTKKKVFGKKMASIIILVIVFIFDLIAFALAVAAEQRRSTAEVIYDGTSSYCQYDKDVATILGVVAFVFLLVSQLVIMLASRCLCCGRGLRPGGSRTWAITLFITCWVFFFIAEVCLLVGSVKNAYHTKWGVFNNPPSCQTLRKGVFGAGAAFIVLTGIISELFYVKYSKSSSYSNSPTVGRDTGVRMSNL